MNFQRFEGMGAAVGIVLIIMIVAWLGLWGPVDLGKVQLWQTLIGGILGGTITGAGILVASFNVSRQMRLTARGREQDRIERELPGLRAALHLVAAFEQWVVKPNPEGILRVFNDLKVKDLNAREFSSTFDAMLPSTPDFVKREMVQRLFTVRFHSNRLNTVIRLNGQAKQNYRLAEKRGDDLAATGAKILEAEALVNEKWQPLNEACIELLAYRDALRARVTLERKRLDDLRQQHEQFLNLDV